MSTQSPAVRRKARRQAAASRKTDHPSPVPVQSFLTSAALGWGTASRGIAAQGTTGERGASGSVRLVLAAILLIGGAWSYWPTLGNLAQTWIRVADYQHGFLILPLAICFLLIRRDAYPGLGASSPWLAMLLFAVSLGLRHAGDAYFFTFLDGWSIVPWTAALVALVGGRPLLAWSWPAIVFLVFMVPLPFSLENELSGPLQSIATTMSTAVLQVLGQPAFSEGNVILLGNVRLEVAQACSGLRLFMFIIAITYAYVAIIQRPWWEKLVLIGAAAPIAIGANVARIVTTGLLYQVWQGEEAHDWIHDVAGWGMVPFAVFAFAMLLWYLRWLIKEVDVMDMTAVVRQSRVSH